jgi:uncharacterized protein (DUF1684 family)
MKTKNIFIIAAIVVLVVIVFYSFQGSQDTSAFQAEIEQDRKDKDHFMRTSKESPFAEAPGTYEGLNYFPPDPKYRIIADLHPITEKKIVTLGTNNGKEERLAEYAYAAFDLDGVHNKLLILEVIEMGPARGKLFLAFGDETSAVETYGAGRYLDVAKAPGSSTITLDFNKAYNPYCAYSDRYTCPLPPPENLLKIPIRAGEKAYHH